MPPSATTPYFPALTGLRAIAAGLVFLHHYNPFSKTDHPVLHAILNEMHIGVSIFFVLSGFLIAYLYQNKITSLTSYRGYLQNRFARIFPLYALLTIITFGSVAFRTGTVDWAEFAWNITLTKGWVDGLKFTGIPQAWSLTVEESFYLLAPVLFVMPQARLLKWLAVVVVLLNVIAIWWWTPTSQFLLIYTLCGRMFEFLVGMSLAVLLRSREAKPARISPTIVGMLLISTCVALMASIGSDHGVSLDTAPGLLFNNLLLPIGTAL